MTMRRQLAAWTVLALGGSMSACTVFDQTPYQPFSQWRGGGYTETEVQPGLFLVRFVGNQSTSSARTADFALLRAADICLQQGREFMRVGGLASKNVQSGIVAGTTTTTVVPATTPDSPPVVTVDTAPPTLLYSPESGLVVSCAKEQEAGAWDANYLARSIRTKYSLT